MRTIKGLPPLPETRKPIKQGEIPFLSPRKTRNLPSAIKINTQSLHTEHNHRPKPQARFNQKQQHMRVQINTKSII